MQSATESYKKMQLYQCDKCSKQATEKDIQYIMVAFYRTDEEVNQLLEAKRAQNPNGCFSFESIREASVIQKKLEVCKDCYVQFKKDYFNL